MRHPSRYVGKPLFRFLECYVLRATGHLDPADEARLVKMTPKLQEILGGTGTWDQILSAALQFPPNMLELVRASWEKNSELARRKGQRLEPGEFAEMFVDANFAIEKPPSPARE